MDFDADDDRLEPVLLAWLWCQKGPSETGKIVKALTPLLPMGEAASAIGEALDRLATAGQISRTEKKAAKGKAVKVDCAIADAGIRRLQSMLRREAPPKSTPWPTLLGGPLTAAALGLPVPASDAEIKSFKKGLPLAICVRRLALPVPLDGGGEATKCAILGHGLGRLFNPPATVVVKKAPPGEMAIIVMASVLGIPPDQLAFKTLDKLIEAAALRLLGATKAADMPATLVRDWLAEPPATASPRIAPNEQTAQPPVFDPETFARKVLAAARDIASTNGPGVSNLRDQVLVAAVWDRYSRMFSRVGLEDFKRHLRDVSGGDVMLVCEDRIPADRMQEFRESEVRIGASVFHYIRI